MITLAMDITNSPTFGFHRITGINGGSTPYIYF